MRYILNRYEVAGWGEAVVGVGLYRTMIEAQVAMRKDIDKVAEEEKWEVDEEAIRAWGAEAWAYDSEDQYEWRIERLETDSDELYAIICTWWGSSQGWALDSWEDSEEKAKQSVADDCESKMADGYDEGEITDDGTYAYCTGDHDENGISWTVLKMEVEEVHL